jgi:uroporphyrinogen decarboxylase
MTGRERILNTLSRKPVDRIPYDLGGTDCSAAHAIPYLGLRKRLGLPQKAVKCGCLVQLIAENDPDFSDAMNVDAEILSFGSLKEKIWKAPFGVDMIVPDRFGVENLADGSSEVRNEANKIYARRAASSAYFDPTEPPLAHVTAAPELKGYDVLFDRWDYSYVYDEPLAALAGRAKKQHASTSRAVVALWRLHYLQAGQLMRGYEQFFVDLMVDKPLAHALLEKLHQVYMKRVEAFLAAFGESIDVVFLTDDLGTQQSGLISPDLYKEMIYPYASELVGRIKKAGKPVCMHSCGAVADFIPYLIEMGVDALNPVQVSATGMNPKELVKQFGRDIAFWGGGCDTQHALNSKDQEVIRADVRQRLKEFGPGASLVFTQVHNIQYDVPPENILTMHEEFRKQAKAG